MAMVEGVVLLAIPHTLLMPPNGWKKLGLSLRPRSMVPAKLRILNFGCLARIPGSSVAVDTSRGLSTDTRSLIQGGNRSPSTSFSSVNSAASDYQMNDHGLYKNGKL